MELKGTKILRAILFFTLFLLHYQGESIEVKDELVLTHHNMAERVNDLDMECGWNCSITTDHWSIHYLKRTITRGGRLFKLRIEYQMEIDDQCINTTRGRSIVNSTASSGVKHLWVMIVTPNNASVPGFVDHALKNFIEKASIEKQFSHSVKALCTFGFRTNNSATSEANISELSPDELTKKIVPLAQFGSLGKICTADTENVQQSCIKIVDFRHEAWQSSLNRALFWFIVLFTYFGPAFIGLFSATEITHQGIRHIIVNGPSPVGFRSLIGNYFSSMHYSTWNMTKRFIMRVLLLPMPFLLPALFVDYLLTKNVIPKQNSLSEGHVFQPFRLLCYGCYFLHAFYLHFIIERPNAKGVHDVYKDLTMSYFSFFVPDLIRNIYHESCKWLSKRFFLTYQFVKDGLVSRCIISKEFLCFFFIHLPVRILIEMCGILAPIFLFLWSGFIVVGALFCPISSLCRPACLSPFWPKHSAFSTIFTPLAVRVVFVVFDIFVSTLSCFGVIFLLWSAALGVVLLSQVAVTVAFTEQNLPFVACLILTCFSLWRNYNSFTSKYTNLAKTLLKFCERPTPDTEDDRPHTVKCIPKALFDVTCEELLPIKGNTHRMVRNVIVDLIAISLAFFIAMLMDTCQLAKVIFICFAVSVSMIRNLDETEYHTSLEKRVRQTVQTNVSQMYGNSYPAYNLDAEICNQSYVGLLFYNTYCFCLLFCLIQFSLTYLLIMF